MRALGLGMWLAVLAAAPAEAQGVIELRFTPTERAQLALWIERPDGTFMGTIRVTEAVVRRGIGNRPGATQMNTGFHYPYGRREGVLPVWAHRRLAASGRPFRRVFFDGRESSDGVHAGEGYASIAGDPGGSNTVDDYFCLSFDDRNNALDAVSCASVFRSNKGRYVTEEDAASGLASEPWRDGTEPNRWRALDLDSLYPPRLDFTCADDCTDHEDVEAYASDARGVMPEIDAVAMATPVGDEPLTVRFRTPESWEPGPYVAWLEVNVEADYNDIWNDDTYPEPTPRGSADEYWDYWSHSHGVAYRGQPSVVYRLPFVLDPTGGRFMDMEVAGYGALHGEDGTVRAMDGRITDDPGGAPGSGVDRLRLRPDGPRLQVFVMPTDVCDAPDPPPSCGDDCRTGDPCGDGLVCGPDGTCVGMCDVLMPPPAALELAAAPVEDERESHRFGTFRFEVPASVRGIVEYQVRFSTTPIVDETTFMRAEEAKRATTEGERLVLPADGPAGSIVESDFGVLVQQTGYHLAVRAVDVCGEAGAIATTELTTTEIHFTTVSPCFVATAAHGTPMASEVRVLRRFRDRHLRNHAAGRALVALYEEVGPPAADLIRDRELLRAAARAALAPLIALAGLLD